MPQATLLNAPVSPVSRNTNGAERAGRSIDALAQPYQVSVVGPYQGTRSTSQFPSSAEVTSLPPGGAIAIEITQNAPILAIPGELQDNQSEELGTARINFAPSGKIPVERLWLSAIMHELAFQEFGKRLASKLARVLIDEQVSQSRQADDIDFRRIPMPPRSRQKAVMLARYMGKGKPRRFRDIFSEE